MKYLFFDLEYASQKGGTSKICEFGYVVTDNNFNVLEKDNLIINPNIYRYEWDYRVLRKILTRKMKEYEKSPTFDKYYDRIVELIKSADFVVGHTMDCDAKALNDDCLRYSLPSIDFTFYDVKIFYKAYKNIKKNVSVANIMKDLNASGDEREHDAEADAYNTMAELKEMLAKLEFSLIDLIELCPEARNKNEKYEVESIVINNLICEERFQKLGTNIKNNLLRKNDKNRKLFFLFLDNVQKNEESIQNLKDLSISISLNYEDYHFKQMMNLVQIICNHGGKYVTRASDANIFVTYPILKEDGAEKYCLKAKFVGEANENGSNIKIITFDEFLNLLGLNEQQLDDLPMVSFDCLCRENAVIKDKRIASIVRGKQKADKSKKIIEDSINKCDKTTIGDLMKEISFEACDYLNCENN